MNFLHYRPGHSFWHRHDSRLKLLETAGWTVIALLGGWETLAAVGGVLVTLHILAGTRFRTMIRPLLFWATMAVVIVLSAGYAAADGVDGRLPGGAGMVEGALRAGRLLAVLLAGQLLAATTDPADLSEAVRRLTAFLPKAWSAALATAISLTISFLPVIMDETAEIRDAAFSRGLGNRRSVFRRAVSLGLPMAEATLRRADLTAEALLARGYVPDPTGPDMRITFRDLAVVLAVTGIPVLAAILFN